MEGGRRAQARAPPQPITTSSGSGLGRVEHRSSQYALYAAACIRGGLQPDLLNDAGRWNTPLWIFAVYALVIYTRTAAVPPSSSSLTSWPSGTDWATTSRGTQGLATAAAEQQAVAAAGPE